MCEKLNHEHEDGAAAARRAQELEEKVCSRATHSDLLMLSLLNDQVGRGTTTLRAIQAEPTDDDSGRA